MLDTYLLLNYNKIRGNFDIEKKITIQELHLEPAEIYN